MTIKIITSVRKLFFSEDVIFVCFVATLITTLFTLLLFTKMNLIITILVSLIAAYLSVAVFMKSIYPVIQRSDNFTSV